MRKLLTFTGMIMGAAFLNAPAFADDTEIGRNSAVKGTVTVTGSDLIESQAIVKEPIFLGDEIKSKSQSSLQILLKDETVFTVGPETQLTIDEYVYNDKKAANRLSASVKRGMFRFVSGKASQESPEHLTINTPTATSPEVSIAENTMICAPALSRAVKVLR